MYWGVYHLDFLSRNYKGIIPRYGITWIDVLDDVRTSAKIHIEGMPSCHVLQQLRGSSFAVEKKETVCWFSAWCGDWDCWVNWTEPSDLNDVLSKVSERNDGHTSEPPGRWCRSFVLFDPLTFLDVFLYVCLNLTQDFWHLLFFGFGVVLFFKGIPHTWGLHKICGGRALCCPSNSCEDFGALERQNAEY